MAPLYKKALIIGATSGIGAALAAKLLETGTSVIVTGRRQSRLDAFAAAHPDSSGGRVTALPLDITQLSALPSFAASVSRAHPDLDCVVLSAGIQRALDFARPGAAAAVDDLEGAFAEELLTNYVAAVHVATAFLPHLRRRRDADAKTRTQTHLVFVGASLGLVPTLVRTPGYNASKAALHSWVTTLRQQLRDADADGDDDNNNAVRVVEVFPPAVQTELHDERHQPDLVGGGQIGMPLAAFVERMYEGLARGDEQFAVGPAEAWLADGGFEAERQRVFREQHPVVKAALEKYIR
ncbi:hypothetical protein F5X99DRAFT_72287 [Biscogniauxia marginata]|nr:hypothetical protein F5X99DRAFT_72287 [Biscogniauxia marginata]